MFSGDEARARSAFERSMAENPNSAIACVLYSANLIASGDFARALDEAERALRLSPRDTFRYVFHFSRAMSLFSLNRYEESAEAATLSLGDRANFRMTWFVLIAALALKDELPAARSSVAKLRELSPEISIEMMFATAPMFRKPNAEKYHEAWLKAGAPE